MSKIRIITDTPSDIDVKTARKYEIPMPAVTITMNNKEYKEGYDFTKEAFYKLLPEGDEIPTTAQIPPFEWLELVKAAYKDDITDLIIVPINSKGSSTFNSALLARQMFLNDNPDSGMKIYIIDTKTYSYCYGYPVLQAAKMIQDGKSIDVILGYLDDWFTRLELYFTTFDLKYAKKSGRIGSASAIAGELLGIKPIINLTGGESVTYQKARGIPKAMDALISIAKEKMTIDKKYLLLHGSNDVKDFAKMAKDAFKEKPLDTSDVGPSIIINAGPEVLGIAFLGDKREETVIC